MAVNAYCVIKGRPGPSTTKKDAIDIISFSFGASQNSVIGAGSSGGEARSGRADVTNVSIMKVTDKLTPTLFEDCVLGTYLDGANTIYNKRWARNRKVT